MLSLVCGTLEIPLKQALGLPKTWQIAQEASDLIASLTIISCGATSALNEVKGTHYSQKRRRNYLSR